MAQKVTTEDGLVYYQGDLGDETPEYEANVSVRQVLLPKQAERIALIPQLGPDYVHYRCTIGSSGGNGKLECLLYLDKSVRVEAEFLEGDIVLRIFPRNSTELVALRLAAKDIDISVEAPARLKQAVAAALRAVA
jgi:hypothetical protein